ncbi:hypothetical protein [Streptomyces sp. CC224B]|uniref:hypothetical protein n=1 Tax=Streptomyces sp. CC224B TaxID=3044571 RepID=UPI0024A7A54B|nr:hypothetical protein [Streptomyces sp. CC224B]
MSYPCRITYAPKAVADLAALVQEIEEAIEEALADPYGGLSVERPAGGGRWDRVALIGPFAMRYAVSDAPGIDPPTIAITRVLP